MSDSPVDTPSTRWTTLNREVHAMEKALNGFTLLGVQDRENNHISSMQEEIDYKIREALMAHWLSPDEDQLLPGTC